MRKEILTEEQVKLLPLVKKFNEDFGLVGGTAIALQIGHRRSIDFDLFSNEEFDSFKIKRKISQNDQKISRVYKDEKDQFIFLINKVQFTFFYYPFKINFSEKFNNALRMPNLLTLSAMKAYALGRRAKWKDYVDLYFILSERHSVSEISKMGKKIFANEFNERIFREQLGYFNDIDYSEKVEFLPGFEVSDKIIKKALIDFSLEK